MAIRFEFKEEVKARLAMNDCLNLGYWGVILHSGKSRKAACILECSEDMEDTIRQQYGEYILD